MMTRSTDPLELAGDAVLLASAAVVDGAGDDAAHSLIHGVYDAALTEAMQQAAASARPYLGTPSEGVARAVGEHTAEVVISQMARLLLGAVVFGAQAISDLAQATSGSAAGSVRKVLEALRV